MAFKAVAFESHSLSTKSKSAGFLYVNIEYY